MDIAVIIYSNFIIFYSKCIVLLQLKTLFKENNFKQHCIYPKIDNSSCLDVK
jgi:hypothetical protein